MDEFGDLENGGFSHLTAGELSAIETRWKATSAGPWAYCGEDRGGCPCCAVWTADHPVADLTHGPWGDPYVDIVLTGGTLDRKAEPVMKMIEYGEVPLAEAKANAVFVAHAHQDVPALLAEVRRLREIAGIHD